MTSRLRLFLVPWLLLVLVGCSATAPAGNRASGDDAGMGTAGEMEEEMEGPAREAMDEIGDESGDRTDEMMGEDEMAKEMTGEEEMAGDDMATEEMAGDDMATKEMVGDVMAGDMDEEMGERPAWQLLPLTNARTGETFSLADFHGIAVFVQAMATWCPNCRQQLENVRAAQALAPGDTIFVALSVETSLPAGELAGYAGAAGFDWIFAVMTPEMLQALVDEFGRPVANPPSTPHFVVGSGGSWTELVTGIDSPEAIVALIEAVP